MSGALRVLRCTGASGNRGHVGVSMNTNILVSAGTQVVFDAKATFCDVGAGCGWTRREFPINVWLTLRDSGNVERTLIYGVNYGGAIQDQDDGSYK